MYNCFAAQGGKGFVILLGLLLSLICISAVADVEISEANFPDANFRKYITDAGFDTDGNGVLSGEEIGNVKSIICSAKDISDLTGISYFTALTQLNCSENGLTDLDVSGCTALTDLECSYNQLTDLDVSGCTALTDLECSYNQLTDLDVSRNVALTYLYCASNRLTGLDVRNNAALTQLYCYENQLTELDVSRNAALKELICNTNQLTGIDVSQNTLLKYLACNSNQLTSLDVSQNTLLTHLDCGSNQLTSLDVRLNTALIILDCNINQLTSLDVSQNTLLEELNCSSNELTELDVGSNTKLSYLFCSTNQFTSLDVSQNTLLTHLDCSSNQLTNLDVSKNTLLIRLSCFYNQLTTLDLTANAKLRDEIAKYEVTDTGNWLQIGYLNEEYNYWDPLVLEVDFPVNVLPEGTVSYVIPEKSDNIAVSLSGAHNVSVKVGETIALKMSDYQLYPEGSLLSGRGTLQDAEYEFWGWNYIFNGRSETHWGEEDGTTVCYITPNTPDYYTLQAIAYYYDKYSAEQVEIRSDIFILTVLKEDGSEPEMGEIKAAIYPFAGATVGETVQINWKESSFLNPGSKVIRIEKDGNVLDEWDYAETGRDTYLVSSTGVYDVYITLTDVLNRTTDAHITLSVTEPKPLEFKRLHLTAKDIMGNEAEGLLHWSLESEGGYGNKTTDVYLVHADTGEEELILSGGCYVAWSQYQVPDGTYFIRMNLKDDQGDHWIESNRVTLPSQMPAWDFILPAQTKVIEAEAFDGVPASNVYIPSGAATIEAAAFANSKIQAVYIPSSVTSIADDAIPSGTVVYTTEESYVYTWALERGYTVRTE